MFLASGCSLRFMSHLNKRLVRRAFVGLIALFLLGVGLRELRYYSTALAQAQDWEPEIRKFEAADKANPPKLGQIVFTGSSSIRRWDSLAADMDPLDVINRGFGGSQFTDLNQYAKRIVVAYHPRAVVVYEGDNDFAAGSPKTPQSVTNDAKQFVKIVHSDLPETWIYVLSIKPSKLRWEQWPTMKAANELLKNFAKSQENVQYIDVASAMFDAKGNLPADLFIEDGLHPTPKCYALWTSIIKPVLIARFGPPKIHGEIENIAPVFGFNFQDIAFSHQPAS
jgi:lysophospholipase L1-like esterase